MAGLKTVAALAVVFLAAALYQLQVPRFISLGYGLFQTLEPLSSFPYTCRRLEDERLRACEDMWLSERSRRIFLACSDPLAKRQWCPNAARFNASGRSLRDGIVALDIDVAEGSSFRTRTLGIRGFGRDNNEKNKNMLHVNGFGAHDDANGDVRIWVTNVKPSVDAETGAFLDNARVGANTTVELLRLSAGVDDELEHVFTFHHPLISTVNRVAPVINGDKNDFWVTNDHGQAKTGLKYELSPLLGTGDVTMCRTRACWKVATGLRYPNGLVKGADGLVYVPSSSTGVIEAFEHVPRQGFQSVARIETGYAVDNLSVDKRGDLYAAVIPQALRMLDGFDDPLNARPPAAALRITRDPPGPDGAAPTYTVKKIIEDMHGEVISGATTVIHDAETGRLFFSGAYKPVAVCEPK